MSFILDALKKSEIERQRQTEPGLMDTRVAQQRTGLPLWAVLIGVLLLINVIVLSFMLMHNRPAPAPLAAARPADKSGTPASEHFSPLDPAPVYAPEIPVTGDGASAPRTQVPRLLPPPPHSVRRADPVLSEELEKVENDEVLPSINELSLTGAQALPEMHLDVHVYATKPADRFVYINMRKYHEGNTLQEGPVLERIKRDGVILNYQGLRFVLPRQS